MERSKRLGSFPDSGTPFFGKLSSSTRRHSLHGSREQFDVIEIVHCEWTDQSLCLKCVVRFIFMIPSLSCGLQRASMLSVNQWPHRNISHFLVWSSLPIVLLFSIPSYFLTNKPFASLGRMKLCHKRLSLATIPLRDISLSVLMLHCLTNPLCMFWTSVYVNSYNCPIEQIPASLDVITRKVRK